MLSSWPLVGLLVCASAPPFSLDEVDQALRLRAADGAEAEVVVAGKKALVRFQNVESELNGLVFLADKSGSPSDFSLITPIDGRRSTLIRFRASKWMVFNNTSRVLELLSDPSVDVKEVFSTYSEQMKAGRQEAVSAFDVAGYQARQTSALNDSMAKLQDTCKAIWPIHIKWDGLSEEGMLRKSASSYCSGPISALKRFCKMDAIRPLLKEAVQKVECQFGSDLSLSLHEGTLSFTSSLEASNIDRWVVASFRELKVQDHQIGDLEYAARSTVCRKGKSYVALLPSIEGRQEGLAVGRPSHMILHPTPRFLWSGAVFDPRFPNMSKNENFRGYDMRFYNSVEAKDGFCKMTCGEQKTELAPLNDEEKRVFFAQASFVPRENPRKPHALARDKRGIYYYVDRGATEATEKQFRLYVGRLGQLRRQKMKDVVSDSEGEVFAGQKGHLRLIVGKDQAEWIRGRRTRKLTRVPVGENLGLIYNQLGVYDRVRLHTPCEVFSLH